MRCQQCGQPAMFRVGPDEVPLCVRCNAVLVQTLDRQNEMGERLMNWLTR